MVIGNRMKKCIVGRMPVVCSSVPSAGDRRTTLDGCQNANVNMHSHHFHLPSLPFGKIFPKIPCRATLDCRKQWVGVTGNHRMNQFGEPLEEEVEGKFNMGIRIPDDAFVVDWQEALLLLQQNELKVTPSLVVGRSVSLSHENKDDLRPALHAIACRKWKNLPHNCSRLLSTYSLQNKFASLASCRHSRAFQTTTK